VELPNQLTQNLSITPDQAKGGAGLLFQLAKNKLGGDDFGKVAGAVPGIEDMIKAVPSDGPGAMVGNVASSLGVGGGLQDLAGLAGGFSKLGLSPDLVQKFVPIVLSFAQSKGGDVVKNLLAGVLK
jgi:hypothetical protein